MDYLEYVDMAIDSLERLKGSGRALAEAEVDFIKLLPRTIDTLDEEGRCNEDYVDYEDMSEVVRQMCIVYTLYSISGRLCGSYNY